MGCCARPCSASSASSRRSPASASLQRSLIVRDRDLELLLGAAQEESEGGNSTDDFAKLVQGCVDHLGCAVGALLIPDKNIAVCRTASDTPPRAGAEILTRTHRQVLGWAQLHRQTMTSNVPHDSGPVREHPVQDPGLPRDARRAARARRAGAVQAPARPGLRPAPGAHRRTARAPRRLHPDELVRPDARACSRDRRSRSVPTPC